MAKQYFYRYAVTGVGSMPLDMLRYDACWPYSSDAVNTLYDAMYDKELNDKTRTIELMSYHKPTVDRWSSFGWVVGEVERRG